MFERFTDRARRVVVLAQEEARLLNHSYIGTEHILLGVLRQDEGMGPEALRALGIELEPARDAVVAIVGQGTSPPTSQIPFTPRAKKVLELSLRETIALGHREIGAAHILLGILREGEGVANHVLTQLGATPDAIRHKLAELFKVEPSRLARPAARPSRGFGCKHPDESLQVTAVQGMRIVRCARCGELVGVLPDAGEAS